MIHLLVGGADLAGDIVEVEGPDHRHLFRARRLRVGDRVRLVDGRGSAAWSTVGRVTAERAELSIEGAAPLFEPARRLTLLACVVRPERAAWLVEKATEMGIRRLLWFTSERTSRQLTARALERQRRVAKSALEQSGGAWLPDIAAPVGLSEVQVPGRAVVLHPAVETPLASVAASAEAIVVGPEGGFSDRELDELLAHGAAAAHLGPRILRTETAAVAAVALVLAHGGASA